MSKIIEGTYISLSLSNPSDIESPVNVYAHGDKSTLIAIIADACICSPEVLDILRQGVAVAETLIQEGISGTTNPIQN